MQVKKCPAKGHRVLYAYLSGYKEERKLYIRRIGSFAPHDANKRWECRNCGVSRKEKKYKVKVMFGFYAKRGVRLYTPSGFDGT